MKMQSKENTQKPIRRPVIVYKSFRLIDFTVYDSRNKRALDEIPQDSSDEDSMDPHSPKSEPKFLIQMFGVNEKSETCSIIINDYQPFFYVKVTDNWTDADTRALLFVISRQAKISTDKMTANMVKQSKLYGFDGGRKYNFVRLSFKTISIMNRVKNLWYVRNHKTGDRRLVNFRFRMQHQQQNTELELYEANIPPLLRYFHINNISPSGWIKVPQSTSSTITGAEKTTSCTHEYNCSLKDVKPMAEKETRVPYKICSFDIEASSSHGDFPIPKKTYKRLAMNIVDMLVSRGIGGNAANSSPEMIAMLLKQCILSAFGYDTMYEIDTVYPKTHPSPEHLETLIQKFLTHDIDQKKAITVASKNTLQNMFEKLQSQSYFAGGGGAAAAAEDDDAAGDETAAAGDGEEVMFEIIESDEGEEDSFDDIESVVGEEASQQKPTKKRVTVSAPKNSISIILHRDFSTTTRDEKIIMLDYLFQECLFPPLEGDKVTFVGSTFMMYGEKEPYKNHCIVLGSCDPVEGAIIETANTEQDLLMRWKEMILRENPDIIIGYNIFGFDYEFLFRRAEENHCVSDFLEFTRIFGEKSGKVDYKTGRITNIAQTNVALASGEYELKYFIMTGRLQIDMYTYMRREFNLSSYKLDDVAGQFIGDDIKKIEHNTAENKTLLYTKNITGLHENDFIHIEVTGFTTDTYGEKHRILTIAPAPESDMIVLTIAGIHNIDQSKNIRWGLAKDDVSPQDIFRMTNEGPTARAVVAKYCIQDCNLVHHLLNKIDVITGYIEMSRICSVPISFLVFRGQGIKLTSYVAKKCREKNTLMPDLQKSRADDGYEGAIVLPPKCSMYVDNPVACVDYASLYPSSMISENLSHDSKVWTKEYDLQGNLIKTTGLQDCSGNFIYDNLPGYEYVNIEFDTFRYIRPSPTSRAIKTKVGRMICRWAQFPHGQKAIMPSILEELLRARADTRKLAKTVSDPFMQNILDKRQLGYKVTANSLYGQCGSRTSTFYEKDIAASTTATGRKMITYARRIIEEVYGGGREYETAEHGTVLTHAEYVYGDTDSVFFTFNLKDPITKEDIRGKRALEITIEIAQDVAQTCSKFLKAPMDLAYEKTLMPFILLSKKRYVGMLYETNPNKGKLKYMGLSLKRRDSCDYLKDTYGNIIKLLMKGDGVKNSIDYLLTCMKDLIQGQVPIEKLILTRSLRSDYKDPQRIAHKVLADRIAKRDPGNKPKSGDRLKFAYIVNKNSKSLLGERIETPEFISANGLKIDYSYYITNQLMKPLQQLFGLAIEQIWHYKNGRTADSIIRRHRRELASLQKDYPDMEIFMKKKEQLCSKEVKKMLFDDILIKIHNENARNSEITSFFAPRKSVNF